jgi:hypothetical protein
LPASAAAVAAPPPVPAVAAAMAAAAPAAATGVYRGTSVLLLLLSTAAAPAAAGVATVGLRGSTVAGRGGGTPSDPLLPGNALSSFTTPMIRGTLFLNFFLLLSASRTLTVSVPAAPAVAGGEAAAACWPSVSTAGCS